MNPFSLFLRYGSILLSAAGFYAIVLVSKTQAVQDMPPPGDPPVSPPAKPFREAVAATGILEALSDNVSIGVPAPGLVMEIMAKVNDPVKTGQPLFRIDDRELRADELSRKSDLMIARAQASVQEAQVAKLEGQLHRLESVSDPRAVSTDDLENRRHDLSVARAQSAAARVQVEAAETALQRLALLIERLTVRSPRDGTVIQVNIRVGEYAAVTSKPPAMVVGGIQRLQVRADVDEQNATRVRPGAKALAWLKGDPSVSFPLEFIRVEPYVIPKVSLTGASTERVDTRVLQVLYSLQRPSNPPLYVGQQVDVFIEAPENIITRP